MKREDLQTFEGYAQEVAINHASLYRIEKFLRDGEQPPERDAAVAARLDRMMRNIMRQLPRLCDITVALVGEVRRLRGEQQARQDAPRGPDGDTARIVLCQQVARMMNETAERGQWPAAADAPAVVDPDGAVLMRLADGTVLRLGVELLPGQN